MGDISGKFTVGDGGAEQPHISKAPLSGENNESSKSEIKYPLLDQENVVDDSLLEHFTSDVTNATIGEVIGKDSTTINFNTEQIKSKRIMLNRLSAKRSRMKRVKYVEYLEKYLKDLEVMVSGLSSQVEHEKQEQARLMVENSYLVKNLDTYIEISNLKNAQLETTRAQIEKLKEVQMKRIYNELSQQEKVITGWEFDNSELNEITTSSFYLESRPPNLDEKGDVDLMIGLSSSATRSDSDIFNTMQNLNSTTDGTINNIPN